MITKANCIFMKLLVLILCCGLTMPLLAQETEHKDHKHSIQHAFIENKGQWDNDILFKSHFQGGNLWVQQGKLLFHLQDYSAFQKAHGNSKFQGSEDFRQHVVHVNFAGANKIESVTKQMPTREYYNFFLGNDKSKWTSEVHGYSEVTMHNLYNGIDLKLIEEQEQLKYEFHVAPGINPGLIVLDYAGHNKIEVDKNGSLIVKTPLGNIQENKPYAYQVINGKMKEVSCSFSVKDNKVTFDLGSYDKAVALVIDPTLVFATYSGSITDNFGMTATYGYDGTAYSGGTIYGNAYPTPDNAAYGIASNFTVPNVSNSPCTDVFVSKYSSDGSTMIWTAFLGGGDNTQGTETVHSLICDKLNNVYLYGATSSTDFPIQNGYQTTHQGGSAINVESNGAKFGNVGTDIYVSKLSFNGHNLLGSTYLGGSKNDGVNYNIYGGNYPANRYDSLTTNYGDQFRGEVMLDSLGNCWVASCTRSTNFPVTPDAIQNTNRGMQDGVIFKLNSSLSNLMYSTYIGGSNNDACYSIKIDSSYHIVFAGGTNSTNLPATAGAWKTTHSGGKGDGFVGKLSPSGTTLQRISYVGTSNYDQVFFVEIDRYNNVFLLGQSRGGTFPVVNAGYSNPNSGQFIAKLSPDLSTLRNSTVFGNGNGQLNISPSAFLVDNCGNIYVSGWGGNILSGPAVTGMAVTPDAYLPNSPNGFDFYLMVINRTFNNLIYATYMGGNQADEHVDGGTSRFDKDGVVYQSVCAGCWGLSDFPTTSNAWSEDNLSSFCNNLIFKFDFDVNPIAEFTTDQTSGCAALEVTFNNTSTTTDSYKWDFGDGNLDSTTFNPTVTFPDPGQYEVFLYVTDTVCQITDTAQIIINVLDSMLVDAGAPIQMCAPTQVTLTGNSFGSGDQFIWSTNRNFTNQLNTALGDSTTMVTPPGTTIYYFKASNALCAEYDSVVVEFVSSAISMSGDNEICIGSSGQITVNNQSPSIDFDFVWSPDSIITTDPTLPTITVNPMTSQYVYVSATTTTGCSFRDSIWLEVIDPVAQFTPDQLSGCAALEVTFSNSSTQTGTTFLWDFGNGSQSTDPNPTMIFTNPGQYEVSLYVTHTVCNLKDTTKVTITVVDALIVEAGNEIQMCAPTEITFTGTASGGATSFIWSSDNTFSDQLNDSQTDPTLTITPAGSTVYYFQASNQFCSKYDSVIVTFTSSALDLTGDTGLCAGDQTEITLSNSNPAIDFDFTWSPASVITSDPTLTSVTVNPPTTQYIYVLASASNGCVFEDSILINVSNLGNINVTAAASQYLVTSGTTVTLTGQPATGYTHVWTPSEGVHNPANAQTDAVVDETTIYTYTASDGFCAKSDTIMVKVLEFVCDDPFIFVPNAFSPNKDGDNDILYVRGVVIEKMLFRVFDRWGEMVFESTSPSVGWDGIFRGKACDPDVYDYYLEATCVGGMEKLIKGNITLLK